MKLLDFRIRNYKSIVDSGVCELSSEGITVLAGQNEAGKTSILRALRDFEWEIPIDPNAKPDNGEDDAQPSIECTFSIEDKDTETFRVKIFDSNSSTEQDIRLELAKFGRVTLRKTGATEYSIVDSSIVDFLHDLPRTLAVEGIKIGKYSLPTETADGDQSQEDKTVEVKPYDIVADFTEMLARQCPYMIYYESFDGRLPNRKYLSDIEKKGEVGFQAVQDFIKLAKVDVEQLSKLTDHRAINNYLDTRSAKITGEFLDYWSQKYDSVNRVEIGTELMRDEKGQYLSFFVKDGRLRKYPEQRSKGFLWFLSFYLRLNAESLDKSDLGAIVLIDEPGSYLHQKAQKDILKVLKDKVVGQGNQVMFTTHSSDLIDPERLNRGKRCSQAAARSSAFGLT